MIKLSILMALIFNTFSTRSIAGTIDAETCVPHLKQRINAEDWRVRYVLPNEFLNHCRRAPRMHLETLIRDVDSRVSNQALVVYLINYVNVDIGLVRERFKNLNAGQPTGITISGPQDVKSVAYQASWLDRKNIDEPRNGPRLEYIGLLGKRDDRGILLPFAKANNPYVLINVAKALIRIGEIESGMAALDRILQLDVATALHYQTQAVYVIDELDHERAKQRYDTLSREVRKNKTIQPGWISAHFVQGLDLG